jgi:hypothetical protein
LSVVCCQAQVSATSWSLVQRSPTNCGASCDLETSRMKRPWPALGRSATAGGGERWAHGCPKRVENRNKHTWKEMCVKLVIYKDCTDVHIQQNIKNCH